MLTNYNSGRSVAIIFSFLQSVIFNPHIVDVEKIRALRN